MAYSEILSTPGTASIWKILAMAASFATIFGTTLGSVLVQAVSKPKAAEGFVVVDPRLMCSEQPLAYGSGSIPAEKLKIDHDEIRRSLSRLELLFFFVFFFRARYCKCTLYCVVCLAFADLNIQWRFVAVYVKLRVQITLLCQTLLPRQHKEHSKHQCKKKWNRPSHLSKPGIN